MCRYYLHTRKNRKGESIYYAELLNADGHWFATRSTGKKDEKEALMVVSRWLVEASLPAKRKQPSPLMLLWNFPKF